MKRISIILIIIMMLMGCGCHRKSGLAPPQPLTHLVINGQEQDVSAMTFYCYWHEESVRVPIYTLLTYLGASTMYRPVGASVEEIYYELMGQSFIENKDACVFMFADEYISLVEQLYAQGALVTKYRTKGKSLIQGYSGGYADSKAIEDALLACGFEIEIEADFNTNTIYVTVGEDWFRRIRDSIENSKPKKENVLPLEVDYDYIFSDVTRTE